MPLKRFFFLFTVLFFLFFFPFLSPISADWTYNPTEPTCSISFSGTSPNITATLTTDGAVTSFSKDGAAITNPHSWTPTANTTFNATTTYPTSGNSKSCSSTYLYTAPCPTAQSCPTTCHTETLYVPDGLCGDRICPPTAPPAGIIPACRVVGGSVADGACGTTLYDANCTACSGDICVIPPPTPNITKPACISSNYAGSGITISWINNSVPVTWVDISTDSLFTTYYHKAVSGTANTAASTNATGFNKTGYPTLTYSPDIIYSARLFNGLNSNLPATFLLSPCAPWLKTSGGDVHSNQAN